MLRDRHIIAMYRYRPLYGDPPAGDYVGDLAAVTISMIAIGMNPDIGLLGIFGATIAAGFITHIIGATYRSLDAFLYSRHWLPVW